MNLSAKELIERLELTPDMINKGGFVKNHNLSIVYNTALHDPNLSLKAKGLYGLICYYQTGLYSETNKSELIEQCKEGETAFDSAWKELKDKGYLKQYRIRVPKGHPESKNGFIYIYELLDKPDLTNVGTINLTIDEFKQIK